MAWKANGNLGKSKTAEEKKRDRKQAKERKRERIRDWLKKHSFFTSKIYDFVEMTLKEENDPEIDFTVGEVMFVYKQNLITAASGTIEKEGD